MIDFIQNVATFLFLFYVEFWLCSTNATDAPKLDLDLLKLLKEAKTEVRAQGTIKIVEAAYVKLKDHAWYSSERLVPPTLFSARVTDRDKKEMANAILKYENQVCPDCQQMPKQKILGQNLKHFVGPYSWVCFELLHGKEPAFLTKRVQKWSTKKSYLSLKEVGVPIKVVNDCVKRSLGSVTNYHIDRITKSEEQKFHLYEQVTELRSRRKKIGEKSGLSKKLMNYINYSL